MKSKKLCSVLVILSIAVLSATAAHADEPDAVGVEETASETGEPVDPMTALRDRNKGTGLMTAAFVAQGISLSTTFASIFESDVMLFSWIIQASTIPFAPMGVHGFALRFGGANRSQRLHWTGVGLLQAAAFSGLVGGVTIAALANPNWGQDLTGIFAVPGMISHFGASIAFVIAGGVCVEAAKAPARWHRLSQSRRSPARPPPTSAELT